MTNTNDFTKERSCVFKGEEYLVRDNGAVLRKSQPQSTPRKLDNIWTFGKLNNKTGYLEIASVRVHRIVATAFHGNPPTKEYVVDHIDTNRQNNRPDNLRWITRLENVVLNPITRKRIEYRTGVSIGEFLKNPAKYREMFADPDFAWMRRVSEEEAKQCLINFQKWSNIKEQSLPKSSNGIGEWIFQPQIDNSNNQLKQKEEIDENELSGFENVGLTDSLSPLAKQRYWRIPAKFLCCPEKIDGDPIVCYLHNVTEGAVFNRNQYGDSIIKKFASIGKDAIVIISAIPSPIKPYALAKITFEDGFYVHESLGTFFTYEGAEKQFTLAQGLEWTGEDSIDDYC